ncbi:hypothetical protein Mapa_003606 [Marchantia paleacea]|nr:hypothetical protein Mapa_003606 [Marchantia paleacea]
MLKPSAFLGGDGDLGLEGLASAGLAPPPPPRPAAAVALNIALLFHASSPLMCKAAALSGPVSFSLSSSLSLSISRCRCTSFSRSLSLSSSSILLLSTSLLISSSIFRLLRSLQYSS